MLGKNMLQKVVKFMIALPFVAAGIIGLIAGGIAIYSHVADSESSELVMQASREADPTQMELTTGANKYIRRIILPDHTETGILTTSDGDEVKYWFRCHHLSNDLGAARFVFPRGHEKTVSGYFCCEVMFPQERFESTAELESFLTEIDGTPP